ncbi:hypothetical protein JTE90_026473 [Oedothorax gibbosus]|uniref:Insulin-like domain-containing protein n=1 Tax=Oedothorax gibbosus TaxID=931172 RepID=A0AAV6VQZ2_9ARAC|nr:hypothetical protein JTE90_026473 [Oedothorax gibbosus]
MLQRQLMLLALGVVVCLILQGENVQGVRMCGRRLADLLNFICERHGGFHAPKAKRDVTDRSSGKRSVIEIIRPLSRRTLSNPSNAGGSAANLEVEVMSPFRSGVVDECCRKQCTLATLASYCANSKHAENIDLDEMLPPGAENVPAISAEDLAEYQLQHDSAKAEETNAVIPRPFGLHPGRPNLGQFMRNRPVFIVMSQLQSDEDRALGDYRF